MSATPPTDSRIQRDHVPATREKFFGWRVTWAAFTVAVFGWGVGFYGPPVFLHAIHEARGWPIWLVSSAITSHFLLGAFTVANLPALHRRFGVAAVTRVGGILSLVGMLGWALAAAPWQLFLATSVSGAGWAATGAAAINAMVSPWFVRRRPAALSTAYNGASVGGIILSPLWVVAIGALGFPWAVALVGGAMALTLWWLSGRYFRPSPADLGQAPDGDAVGPMAAKPVSRHGPLPGRAIWTNRRFLTLVAGTSFGLFAQIGLIAHLFSLMAGPMGPRLAGLAAGLATVCAVLGRTGMGWLLTPTADRRIASAGNYGLQVVGSLVLLASGGSDVTLLLLGVALFGLGLGNSTSLPPLIAQQDFSAADTARAVALSTACGQAAYAFAPAAFGAMRDIFASTDVFFITAASVQVLAAVAMLAGRQPSR
jgi:hypothetical protein